MLNQTVKNKLDIRLSLVRTVIKHERENIKTMSESSIYECCWYILSSIFTGTIKCVKQ